MHCNGFTGSQKVGRIKSWEDRLYRQYSTHAPVFRKTQHFALKTGSRKVHRTGAP